MTDAEEQVERRPIDVGLARVEAELAVTRRWGERSLREMSHMLSADLMAARMEARRNGRAAREAEAARLLAEERADAAEQALRRARKRARAARKAAAAARARARRAEDEVAALRGSTTWRAGHAITAVPARVRAFVRR